MWKKDDEPKPDAKVTTVSGSVGAPKSGSSVAAGGGQATIGRSITIRGDVTGDENLIIQGRVEGTVNLGQHNVTVGPEGRVKADISARMVSVEGEVEGDVRGAEQVALRAASTVKGDITAPRVVLEDGATFLGTIDMSGQRGETKSKSQPAAAARPSADNRGQGKPDTGSAVS